MKPVKYLILVLFLVALFGLIKTPANAILGVDETDSEEYLLNHGHSRDITRMIELQEKRTLAKGNEIEKNNRFVKFMKNLYYERVLTLPLHDFGHNDITTPESPKKDSFFEELPELL